ncbi:MAG: hypothetical protein ACTSVL_06170 [Promethearchaeota archaeon]
MGIDKNQKMKCKVCNEVSTFKEWDHISERTTYGSPKMYYDVCPNCGVLVRFSEKNIDIWKLQ